MLFNYEELNENILYLVENLKYIEKKYNIKLDSISSEFSNIQSSLNNALQICLKSRDLSEAQLQKVKRNLFTFLVQRYVGEKQLVPAPKLSFELIICLAIDNQLENVNEIFKSFEETISQSLHDKLIIYLMSLLEQHESNRGHFEQSILLFSIEFIFSSSSTNGLSILMDKVFLALESNQTNFSATVRTDRIINKMIGQISKLMCFWSGNYSVASEMIPSLKIYDRWMEDDEFLGRCLIILKNGVVQVSEFLMDLVYYLTERFTSMDMCLKDSGRVALETLCTIYTNIEDLRTIKRIDQFYSYITDLLKNNYQIEFDEYFIITNKLYGCEDLLQTVVLSKSFEAFSERDLECLNCFALTNCLLNTQQIYNVLRRLDSPLTNEAVKDGLGRLFWQLFQALEPPTLKIELVARIYDDNEILLNTPDGSVVCLDNEFLRNALTIGINQISFGNCEDLNVINTHTKLFCAYFHILLNRLLANAVNNKTQIPVVLKILRTFSKLLTCKSTHEPKITVFVASLNRELSGIMQNRNEKLFQNYCKLLQEASREPSLYKRDEFFQYSLANEQLKLTGNDGGFNFSLLYSYQIYEIIYKTGGSEVVHLIYFLQVLNILKFVRVSDMIDPRIMSLKEKCITIIKALVENFKTIQMDKVQIQRLREFTLRSLYWPFSSLIVPITKRLVLPSCFKELIVNENFNHVEICYFAESNLGQMDSLLELLSINPDMYSLLKQLECFEYNTLLVESLKVISQTRSSFELKNLFQAFTTIFANIRIDGFELDDEVVKFLQDKGLTTVAYANCLNFLIDQSYILSLNTQLGFYLSNLDSFLKDRCLQAQVEQESFEFIVLTIYYLQKVFLFVKSMEGSQDTYRFAVELLNHAVQMSKNGKTVVSKENTSFIRICLNNMKLIEDPDNTHNTYKYLLKQNLENLLKR